MTDALLALGHHGDPVLVLICVMVIAKIFQDNGASDSIYAALHRALGSRRAVLAATSMLFGVLPIPNRITVTAAMLSNLHERDEPQPAFGIIAFLASHHYYLWSPVEKAVLIVMAGLGLSYVEFMAQMWPYVVVCVVYVLAYIALFVDESEIMLAPVPARGLRRRHLVEVAAFAASFVVVIAGAPMGPVFLVYTLGLYLANRELGPLRPLVREAVDWTLVGLVLLVVGLGFAVEVFAEPLQAWVAETSAGEHLLPALLASFLVSLALGSSSRYAAMPILACSVFGLGCLPLFYVVDFCAYLLSPMHKCVVIAHAYFATPARRYYAVVGGLCLVLSGIAAGSWFF